MWNKEDGDFMIKFGPHRNYNFPWGSNRDSVEPEVEITLWSLKSGEASCACEQHIGGRCKSENSRTKEDGASRKFATGGPKNMVILLYLFGPIKKL